MSTNPPEEPPSASGGSSTPSDDSDDESSDDDGNGSDGDGSDDGSGNNDDGDGDAAMPDIAHEPDTSPQPPNTATQNSPQRSSRSASLFVRANTTTATDRHASEEAPEDEQPNAVWRFPIDLTGDSDTETRMNRDGRGQQRESPIFVKDDDDYDDKDIKPEVIDLTDDEGGMDIDNTARSGYEDDLRSNNRGHMHDEESLFVKDESPPPHDWDDDIYDI